jgi:hypothetical protein
LSVRPCIASICRYILPSPPLTSVLFFLFNAYTHTVVSFVQRQHSTMAVDIRVVRRGACTGCEGAGCSTHDALVTGFCDTVVPDTCECTMSPPPSLTIQSLPLGLIDAFRVIVHFYIHSVHIT